VVFSLWLWSSHDKLVTMHFFGNLDAVCSSSDGRIFTMIGNWIINWIT
jgi:hypothetical protein